MVKSSKLLTRVEGRLVLWKKIIEGFTIYGFGGHFGQVTHAQRKVYLSSVPWMFHVQVSFDSQYGVLIEEHVIYKVIYRCKNPGKGQAMDDVLKIIYSSPKV